jgi:hypothetical protein
MPIHKWLGQNPTGTLFAVNTTYQTAGVGNYNVIEDDPTPGRVKEKPCKHYSYLRNEHPAIPRQWGWPEGGGATAANNRVFLSNQPFIYLLRTLVPTNTILTSMRPTASQQPALVNVPTSVTNSLMESLLPKVNDGLSVINSWLELEDLRRMFDFKTLEKMYRKIERSAFIPRYPNKRVGERIRENAKLKKKDISDDFLNYNFGISPFFSDLFEMWKTLKGLTKRLDYLERHAGKVLRRHGSRDLDIDTEHRIYNGTYAMKAAFGVPMGYDPIGKFRIDSYYEYKPRYHMTIEYYYTLPKVGALRRHLRALMDALGIRMDPSVIWNAIPYSFVVDWVLDVGGFLRNFTPTDLDMQVVILDASHSVKWSHVVDVTGESPIGPSSATYVRENLFSEERNYYERARFIPKWFAILAEAPSIMQFTLGGALAISNDKRRFRRG